MIQVTQLYTITSSATTRLYLESSDVVHPFGAVLRHTDLMLVVSVIMAVVAVTVVRLAARQKYVHSSNFSKFNDGNLSKTPTQISTRDLPCGVKATGVYS